MVGQWPPPGLCSFSPERRRSADVKTIRELRISVTKQDERGWMSENYPSLQPREKCFLLTSPFIEPGNHQEPAPEMSLQSIPDGSIPLGQVYIDPLPGTRLRLLKREYRANSRRRQRSS